jgi:hypothetical protein
VGSVASIPIRGEPRYPRGMELGSMSTSSLLDPPPLPTDFQPREQDISPDPADTRLVVRSARLSDHRNSDAWKSASLDRSLGKYQSGWSRYPHAQTPDEGSEDKASFLWTPVGGIAVDALHGDAQVAATIRDLAGCVQSMIRWSSVATKPRSGLRLGPSGETNFLYQKFSRRSPKGRVFDAMDIYGDRCDASGAPARMSITTSGGKQT